MSDGGERSEETLRAELFTAPLSEFVALRNAAASELRKGGDREAAARIKTIAKPSAAAWVANALHRERGELWEAAMEGARQLREAQRAGGVTAERMQALVGEQRAALNALVREAPGLAATAGQALNRAQEGKLRATLEALCAGVEGAAPGQLSADLSPPSFDALGGGAFSPQTPIAEPRSKPQSAPQSARRTHGPTAEPSANTAPPAKRTAVPAVRSTTPTVTPRDRERAHTLQQLRELESIRDARSAQRRKAMGQVSAATQELERARAEVAVAQRRLERAQQEAQSIESRLDEAQREQARLTEAVKQAQAAVTTANAALASGD